MAYKRNTSAEQASNYRPHSIEEERSGWFVKPAISAVEKVCARLSTYPQHAVLIQIGRHTIIRFTFIFHSAQNMASSSSISYSTFQLIINNALDVYKKRTKNDLLANPLAAKLQSCNTPSTILDVLQQQIQGLDQSRSNDDRWTRWLNPTVNVLFALSATLGEGVGLVCLIT